VHRGAGRSEDPHLDISQTNLKGKGCFLHPTTNQSPTNPQTPIKCNQFQTNEDNNNQSSKPNSFIEHSYQTYNEVLITQITTIMDQKHTRGKTLLLLSIIYRKCFMIKFWSMRRKTCIDHFLYTTDPPSKQDFRPSKQNHAQCR